MRVLVTGGRNFHKTKVVYDVLDHFHGHHRVQLLIHGAAPGLDTLAAAWASERGVPTDPWPANWDKHGPAAGPIRNAKMLAGSSPDTVIVFPGRRGTNDMHAKARAARKAIVLVSEYGEIISAPGHLELSL